MFGFLIGAACVGGLIHVLRRGRGSCGGRFGGRDCHDGGHDHHRGGRRGFGFAMRDLFRRLDTTPGQEKVIRGAVEEVWTTARDLKGELRYSRADVARAMRAESLDEEALGAAFVRHDDVMDALRKAVVGALAKVHDVLDPQQRERLADWLDASGRPFHFGGPYRSHGW